MPRRKTAQKREAPAIRVFKRNTKARTQELPQELHINNDEVTGHQQETQQPDMRQNQQSDTVLDFDTNGLHNTVTESVVSAITDHIKQAVRAELDRVLPQRIQ